MTLADHYNKNVALMENTDWFYDWILSVWDLQSFSIDVEVCDIGCGSGALLARLQAKHYTKLTGLDFAQSCVDLSKGRVPMADFAVHDIVGSPLSQRFDVITCTTVVDFVADPLAALNNVRASLKPTGKLIISFRNRWAYWPWYHLRHLAGRLPSQRLRHWLLWFTTPLGLRRQDQPYEKVYSTAEARRLLIACGLAPVAEYGFQWLPMLWIPEFPNWLQWLRRFDDWSRPLPGKARHFYYVFVCEPAVVV